MFLSKETLSIKINFQEKLLPYQDLQLKIENMLQIEHPLKVQRHMELDFQRKELTLMKKE